MGWNSVYLKTEAALTVPRISRIQWVKIIPMVQDISRPLMNIGLRVEDQSLAEKSRGQQHAKNCEMAKRLGFEY